jgi:HSP20 family protein
MVMSALIRWNPRTEMDPFHRDPFFRRFFDIFEETRDEPRLWCPAMDLVEEKDRLVARLELPGIDPREVQVTIEGETLLVRGERKSRIGDEQEGQYLRREQVYGAFQRAVQLPYRVQADKVKATCRNGVMTIEMPKAEEYVGRSIPVEVK